jgi:hypothetical protein
MNEALNVLAEQFKGSIAKILGQVPSKSEDPHPIIETESHLATQYVEMRERAAEVLKEFAKNPGDLRLVAKCDRIVAEFSRLHDLNSETGGLDQADSSRLKTNIVTVAATSKRTHYAAYMAGKWGSDDTIEEPYRAWLHNAAADGAISLYEQLNLSTPHVQDFASRRLLQVYADGAFFDASRFLDIADTIYPRCVITKYNRAKLEILEGGRTLTEGYGEDLIRLGLRRVLDIPAPDKNAHFAELGWHENIYKSYEHDGLMRENIASVGKHFEEQIKELLADNCTKSDDEIKRRLKLHSSAMAKVEQPLDSVFYPASDRAKAVVVATATGAVLVACAVASSVPWKDLADLVLQHIQFSHAFIAQATGGLATISGTDVIAAATGGLAHLPGPDLLAAATGGLAQAVNVDATQIVRTIIGSATGGL